MWWKMLKRGLRRQLGGTHARLFDILSIESIEEGSAKELSSKVLCVFLAGDMQILRTGSQVWSHKPVILALESRRQENQIKII